MIKNKQLLTGFLVFLLSATSFFYLFFTQEEPIAPEPYFTSMTLIHFSGFLGTYLFFNALKRDWYTSTVAFCSYIVLWEITEYVNTPEFWIVSWENNLVDILAGLFGIILGLRIKGHLNVH